MICPKNNIAKKKTAEYYIRANGNNGYSFVWKTHTNGGAEWVHESELTINGGNKKPLRYKTYNGAKRMMHEYSYNGEVAVWNE